MDYQFTIFGTPGAKDAWGWRVEGHHLSLHFTIAGGKAVATSPTFTGSNPAEVREGPEKGKRVLAPLEDLGRAMVMALDDGRRKTATYDPVAPGDILTMNKNDIAPLAPAGVVAAEMTAEQRAALTRPIEAYTSMMADDLAADRMAKLKGAGMEKIAFAWAGPIEKGAKHYYRVTGADVPDRVRQHAERRQPHPRGVARLPGRLRLPVPTRVKFEMVGIE